MKKKVNGNLLVFSLLLILPFAIVSQNESTAYQKIKILSGLVKDAKNKGIDTSKEVLAIKTAQIFLKYAKWDKENQETNTDFFEKVHIYKDEAAKWAKKLPEFEISEVNLLLDESITLIKDEIDGKISRTPTQKIDWTKLKIEGNQIINTLNGKPVFLSDWVWKPNSEDLSKYYGDIDGSYLDLNQLINKHGEIRPNTLNKIKNKPSGSLGSVFLGHKNLPEWAKKKFKGIEEAKRHFTSYDIDHPEIRNLQQSLLKATLPSMNGKNYASLFMLANEPHWFTMEKTWNTGPVSKYTREKFRTWLKTKHGSIAKLNSLWKTDFKKFDAVDIEIPLSVKHKGTALWYDWVSFNQFRVTDWFSFLHNTVKEYSPETKTHIKVMTNLWTENKKDHGIDLEAITNITDVIGNDAASYYSLMWGDTSDWDDNYAFHWNEMCMSYDFLRSVAPNKINYNSEGHFLSTVHFRDLEMKPQYARMAYWLAALQGMDMIKTWFWLRDIDGSLQNYGDVDGYGGSNMQQPRVVYEVASTMMDLNAHAKAIDRLQSLPSPLRIFYSKTSSINKEKHMDDVRNLYEHIYFEGLPIGFMTEDIIEKQTATDTEVLLISNTPDVTENEFNKLQEYLDKGGLIIMDKKSLKFNEYGIPRETSLSNTQGKVKVFNTVDQLAKQGLDAIDQKGLLSDLSLTESNKTNTKGCAWRSYKESENKYVISIVNIGKSDAKLCLSLRDENPIRIKNLLNGQLLGPNFNMKSQEVILLEINKL